VSGETLAQAMGIPTPETIDQAVRERNGWLEAAAMHSRNETWLRGLLVQSGGPFGDAAKTSDDGSVQQDVLLLRVPELVAEMRVELQRLQAENAALRARQQEARA
jgi:hypothetical protein